MHDLNVPLAVKPYVDVVTVVTEAVCRAHLDDEYADLCRGMVAKLGRRRPFAADPRGPEDGPQASMPSDGSTSRSTLPSHRTRAPTSSATAGLMGS